MDSDSVDSVGFVVVVHVLVQYLYCDHLDRDFVSSVVIVENFAPVGIAVGLG